MLESLNIGGKDYDLYIGFDFIREADKRHQQEYDGMVFGIGVGKLMMQLNLRNPLAVLDFIQCATITEKQKPAVVDIEALFAEWHEAGKTDEVYDLFCERLAKSPLTAPVARDYYLIKEAEKTEQETAAEEKPKATKQAKKPTKG